MTLAPVMRKMKSLQLSHITRFRPSDELRLEKKQGQFFLALIAFFSKTQNEISIPPKSSKAKFHRRADSSEQKSIQSSEVFSPLSFWHNTWQINTNFTIRTDNTEQFYWHLGVVCITWTLHAAAVHELRLHITKSAISSPVKDDKLTHKS